MWFSSIKVVTIICFIIFAICINAGASHQGYIGFTNWARPGPFVKVIVTGPTGNFVGFWSVLVTAGFSYQGAELVGVGAGETADPAKAVPSAVRWTFWGIFLTPPRRPLVIVAKLAGVKVLPDIINAVLLTAVLSAANSNVYSGSRILVALTDENHAPAYLRRTNKIGTPYVAVGITSAIGLLAYMNLSESGGDVFNWLLNITAIAGFITWPCICVCHLRFMKALAAKGISRQTLPYRASLQPYLTYFGLFFCILILLTKGGYGNQAREAGGRGSYDGSDRAIKRRVHSKQHPG
ncbi:hypothetical protein PG989_000258 [Apiospora arundinis]